MRKIAVVLAFLLFMGAAFAAENIPEFEMHAKEVLGNSAIFRYISVPAELSDGETALRENLLGGSAAATERLQNISAGALAVQAGIAARGESKILAVLPNTDSFLDIEAALKYLFSTKEPTDTASSAYTTWSNYKNALRTKYGLYFTRGKVTYKDGKQFKTLYRSFAAMQRDFAALGTALAAAEDVSTGAKLWAIAKDKERLGKVSALFKKYFSPANSGEKVAASAELIGEYGISAKQFEQAGITSFAQFEQEITLIKSASEVSESALAVKRAAKAKALLKKIKSTLETYQNALAKGNPYSEIDKTFIEFADDIGKLGELGVEGIKVEQIGQALVAADDLNPHGLYESYKITVGKQSILLDLTRQGRNLVSTDAKKMKGVYDSLDSLIDASSKLKAAQEGTILSKGISRLKSLGAAAKETKAAEYLLGLGEAAAKTRVGGAAVAAGKFGGKALKFLAYTPAIIGSTVAHGATSAVIAATLREPSAPKIGLTPNVTDNGVVLKFSVDPMFGENINQYEAAVEEFEGEVGGVGGENDLLDAGLRGIWELSSFFDLSGLAVWGADILTKDGDEVKECMIAVAAKGSGDITKISFDGPCLVGKSATNTITLPKGNDYVVQVFVKFDEKVYEATTGMGMGYETLMFNNDLLPSTVPYYVHDGKTIEQANLTEKTKWWNFLKTNGFSSLPRTITLGAGGEAPVAKSGNTLAGVEITDDFFEAAGNSEDMLKAYAAESRVVNNSGKEVVAKGGVEYYKDDSKKMWFVFDAPAAGEYILALNLGTCGIKNVGVTVPA